MLFDNREIKEHSRKTQRELSKEISSLTSELKDERDRIHELQKENRKLRQEVKTDQKPNVRESGRAHRPNRTVRTLKNLKIAELFGFWWTLEPGDSPGLGHGPLSHGPSDGHGPRPWTGPFRRSMVVVPDMDLLSHGSSDIVIFGLSSVKTNFQLDKTFMSYRIVRSHV